MRGARVALSTNYVMRVTRKDYLVHVFSAKDGWNATPAVNDAETERPRLSRDVPPRPTARRRAERNAFALEIFAMRRGSLSHWSRDFLEAAFDCFPDLEYCAYLLPTAHPDYQFLQYFVVHIDIEKPIIRSYISISRSR